MERKILFLCVVILTLSSVASASSWLAIMWTPANLSTTTVQVGTVPATVGGVQVATANGAASSFVVQQASGVQNATLNSQEQTLLGAQVQIANSSGQGTATGVQIGTASQDQTMGTASQSQTVTGLQAAVVTGTSAGSSVLVVQTAVVQVYQSQSVQ